MRMVAVTATGCSESRGAFKERAEAESNQQELQPAVLGDVHQAVLHDLEAASHDGEVVEKDDVDDDPADGKQAVAGSIHCRGRGHLTGHVKGEDSDEKCGGKSEHGGPMRVNLGSRQRSEQDDDRNRSNESRDEPVPMRIVALRPRSELRWHAQDDAWRATANSHSREKRNPWRWTLGMRVLRFERRRSRG